MLDLGYEWEDPVVQLDAITLYILFYVGQVGFVFFVKLVSNYFPYYTDSTKRLEKNLFFAIILELLM